MRDYKNYQADKQRASSKGGSLFAVFFVGAVLGLAIALGIALWINRDTFFSGSKNKENNSGASSIVSSSAPFPRAGTVSGVTESKNEKDQADVTKDEVSSGVSEDPPEVKPKEATKESSGAAVAGSSTARYDFYDLLQGKESVSGASGTEKPSVPEKLFLQIGAFQRAGDADNLKAKLALMGVEAIVQTQINADKTVVHRVRVGPFSSSSDMQKQRKDLSEAGFSSMIVKVKSVSPKAFEP